MKTNTLIWLDKNLGWFVAQCINWFIRLTGLVFRKDHRLTGNYKTIAIAKYKGLGSILQTLPLIRTLKENYPDSKIIFITSSNNEELLDVLNIANTTIVLKDKGFIGLVKALPFFLHKLIKCRIDLFIDLEIYSSFSSIIAALSLSKNRIGFYHRAENYRFGIYSHMMYYNINAPVFQTYLQTARLVGCTKVITDFGKISVENTLKPEILRGKQYILFNPNASDLRLERRWPSENFVNLIEMLNQKHPDYFIVLIGSLAEMNYVQTITSRFKENPHVFSLAGQTSLKELIAIIANAKLFVSNDTGPMHLSALLNQATVSLFGPCSPAHYGYYPSLKVIYKNLYCSPCVHEFIKPPCNGNNMCMKSIKVDEVFSACNEILENGIPLHPNKNYHLLYSYGNSVAGFIERRN